MTEILMLARKLGLGKEELIGVFDNEPDLLKKVEELAPTRLYVGADGSVYTDLYETLKNFSVKHMIVNGPLPVQASVPTPTAFKPVDLPDHSLTVPSETNPRVTYGVAIVNGDVVACTCPDFEVRRAVNGEHCKHMTGVRFGYLGYNDFPNKIWNRAYR